MRRTLGTSVTSESSRNFAVRAIASSTVQPITFNSVSDPSRGWRSTFTRTRGAAADAGEGTDFRAVESGYVSITPLQIDLTNRDQMEDVTQWLDRASDG